MTRSRLVSIVAVVALAAAACSSGAGTPTSTTNPSPVATAAAPTTSVAPSTPQPTAKVQCPDPNAESCSGPLSPGAHTSSNFMPAISFSVGDGWTNVQDEPVTYFLAKADDPTGNTLAIWQKPIMARSDAACDGPAQPGVGTAVADVVTYLTTNPGLTANAPQAVTIGGLSGQTLDVTVAPIWTQSCPKLAGTPYEGKPFVIVVTEAKQTLTGRWWGLGPDTWRCFVLDGGSRGTLLIVVDATPTTFDAFSTAAQGVLDSLDFTP